MKKRILRRAVDLAIEKLPLHPEYLHFPHFCFVVEDNGIVAWATNTRMEPPLHYGYHRPWDSGYRPKYHAEVMAYRKAMPKPGFEIVNVRLNRLGHIKLSKPCVPCCRLLARLGCRKAYFSSEAGFLTMNL